MFLTNENIDILKNVFEDRKMLKRVRPLSYTTIFQLKILTGFMHGVVYVLSLEYLKLSSLRHCLHVALQFLFMDLCRQS